MNKENTPNKFRPWLKIGITLAITVLMMAGFFVIDSDETGGNESFLPDDSELVEAQDKLSESFPQNSNLVSVQIIGKGEAVLEPESVDAFILLMEDLSRDSEVSPYLAETGAVVSYARIYKNLEQSMGLPAGTDPEEVLSQALQTESVATSAENLDDLLAKDDEGNIVGAIGILTLNAVEGQEDLVDDAQLRIDDLTDEAEIQRLELRSLSPAKQSKESDDARTSSTGILMFMAIIVIMILLAIFYRSFSDVLISIAGLFIAIIWAFGFQNLLGPGGAELVGPTSALIIMVPVILIGLCVDYALQITARYRQELSEGSAQGNSKTAIVKGVRSAILPLVLAGGTTAISLFTNLASEIPANRDLGVIAGLGVLSGLAIMTTFTPSVRNLLDMRRERRSKNLKTKPLADAIPGVNALFNITTRLTVDRPVAVLGPILLITIVALWGATNISTSFSTTEFSPTGAETTEDINYLNDYLGGQTETATILIETELTDDRAVRNLIDLEGDLADPSRRPDGFTGSVDISLGTLISDLATDSGEPGDKYSPEVFEAANNLLGTLTLPSEDLESLFETVESVDPESFAQVAVINPDGPDRTILQIQTLTGDIDRTRDLIASVDGLWYGEPQEISTVAGEVLTVEVVDEMLDAQTQSVLITIAAAAIILMLFFGFSEFRPVLGILAVLPVALALLWVLGTMTLFGITYNVVTALITALSIGIGVDYTIHFIHRFLEETEAGKGVRAAIAATKKSVGGALAGSGLTTALGFLVLVFSPIVGMRQFGIVVAITIIYSFLATIVVLPALLTLWFSYHKWRVENPGGIHAGAGHESDGYGTNDAESTTSAGALQQPAIAKARH